MITYNSVDHCFDPNPVRVAGSSKTSPATVAGLVLAAAVFAATEYLALRLPLPDGGATGTDAGLSLWAPAILAVLSVLVLATTRSAQDRSSILWGFAAILLAANLISIFAASVPLVLIGHLLFGFGIGGFAVGVVSLARSA